MQYSSIPVLSHASISVIGREQGALYWGDSTRGVEGCLAGRAYHDDTPRLLQRVNLLPVEGHRIGAVWNESRRVPIPL